MTNGPGTFAIPYAAPVYIDGIPAASAAGAASAAQPQQRFWSSQPRYAGDQTAEELVISLGQARYVLVDQHHHQRVQVNGVRSGRRATFRKGLNQGVGRELAALLVVGDDLEGFRAGFKTAQSGRARQPARLAGELIGGDVLAFFAAARAQGVQFSRKHVTGIDQPGGLRRGFVSLRQRA